MTGGPNETASRAPSLALQVDRDNVLQARALLLQEADRLDAVLAKVRWSNQRTEQCGNDPVSRDAAIAFPERIEALFNACHDHNVELRRSADALAAVAREYGFTEAEIAAALPGFAPARVVDAVQRVL